MLVGLPDGVGAEVPGLSDFDISLLQLSLKIMDDADLTWQVALICREQGHDVLEGLLLRNAT